MSADALGRAFHCPNCGQEIRLDDATVSQLTEPFRIHWEEEMRQVEERAETKITKRETQLGRVSKDLAKTQRKTRTGSATEEGYARQDLFADELQRRFPQDQITPIHRGMAGADVTQVVRQSETHIRTVLPGGGGSHDLADIRCTRSMRRVLGFRCGTGRHQPSAALAAARLFREVRVLGWSGPRVRS
jgi:hypothetical protein